MTEKAAPTHPTILIVDDDTINLKVLIDHLNEAGYKTLIAKSGKRALRQLSVAQPDLILLDVMMPGLNGFETCRQIKETENTQDIPVIFITALSDTVDKIKGFSVGAVDYITKPFQQEEVLARVNTHVTIRILQKKLETQNSQLQKKNQELEETLATVKKLSGLLPICAHCKKIRNDEGYWQDVAVYIHDHSEADFSHGFCPDCIKSLYPEFYPDS